MPAWGNPRTSTAEWRQLRAQILQRDNGYCHVCRSLGADEVDHIVPVAEGGTDHPSNLAAIHSHPCHATKSALEANRVRWRYRDRREPEPHPGILRRVGEGPPAPPPRSRW